MTMAIQMPFSACGGRAGGGVVVLGRVVAVVLAALALGAGCSSGDGGAASTTLPGSSTTVPPMGGLSGEAVATTLPPSSSVLPPVSSVVVPSTTEVVWVGSEFFEGRFSFDGSVYEVEVEPVNAAPAADRAAGYVEGDGRFVLELRDGEGGVLRRVRLGVGEEFVNPDGTVDGVFGGLVLDPPVYASYAVFRGSDEMVVVKRSDNAPTAELAGVSAGQFFAHTDVIALDLGGRDADGDNLVYSVYYSVGPDAGFELLESGRASPVFSVLAGELAGSDTARFGVSVSDGARSVFVESPVFRVAQHAPRIRILDVPEGGFSFLGAGQVTLEARVEDLEGFPDEASVVWESDLDGPIEPFSEHRDEGYTEIWLETETLSEGDHILTVTATDPTGLSGSHSAPMRILHESYVPPVFELLADVTTVQQGQTVYLDVSYNDIYELGFGHMELLDGSLPSLGEAEVIHHSDLDRPVIKYTAHTAGEDLFYYGVCTKQNHCEIGRVEITIQATQ